MEVTNNAILHLQAQLRVREDTINELQDTLVDTRQEIKTLEYKITRFISVIEQLTELLINEVENERIS